MVAATTLRTKPPALSRAHRHVRPGAKTRVGVFSSAAAARVGARARRSRETRWEISARRRENAVGSRWYLQPEPLLQAPRAVRYVAGAGKSMPAYSYALNNPILYSDKDGQFVWTIPIVLYVFAPEIIAGVAITGAGGVALKFSEETPPETLRTDAVEKTSSSWGPLKRPSEKCPEPRLPECNWIEIDSSALECIYDCGGVERAWDYSGRVGGGGDGPLCDDTVSYRVTTAPTNLPGHRRW